MAVTSSTNSNISPSYDQLREGSDLTINSRDINDRPAESQSCNNAEKSFSTVKTSSEYTSQTYLEHSLSRALIHKAQRGNQARIDAYQNLQSHSWVQSHQRRLENAPDLLGGHAVDFRKRLNVLQHKQQLLDGLTPKVGESLGDLETRANYDLNGDRIIGNEPHAARYRIYAEGLEMEVPKNTLEVSAQIGSFGDIYYGDVPVSVNVIALDKELYKWSGDRSVSHAFDENWSSPMLANVPMSTFLTGAVPLGRGVSVIGGPWSSPDTSMLPDSGSLSVDGIFAGLTFTPLKAPKSKVGKKSFAIDPALFAAWLSGERPAVGGILIGGWGVGKSETTDPGFNVGFTPYVRGSLEYDFSEFEDAVKARRESWDEFGIDVTEESYSVMKSLDKHGKLEELGLTDQQSYSNLVIDIASENHLSIEIADRQVSAFLNRRIDTNDRIFSLPGAAERLSGEYDFIGDAPLPPPTRPADTRPLSELQQELERVDNAIAAERERLRENPPLFDPNDPLAMDMAMDALNQLAGNEVLQIVGEKTAIQQQIYAREYDAMLNELHAIRKELDEISRAMENCAAESVTDAELLERQQRLVIQQRTIEEHLLANDHGWSDLYREVESVRAFLDGELVPNWEMEDFLQELEQKQRHLLDNWFHKTVEASSLKESTDSPDSFLEHMPSPPRPSLSKNQEHFPFNRSLVSDSGLAPKEQVAGPANNYAEQVLRDAKEWGQGFVDFGKAVSSHYHTQVNQAGEQHSVMERRDYEMFAKPGESLSDYAKRSNLYERKD